MRLKLKMGGSIFRSNIPLFLLYLCLLAILQQTTGGNNHDGLALFLRNFKKYSNKLRVVFNYFFKLLHKGPVCKT